MLGAPVINQPWDFTEAVSHARKAAEAQKACEQAVRDASEQLAEAERQYRMALAKEILEQHAAGAAWTVAQDLARGEKRVADLRYARDVAKGVLDAAEQRAWRHTADRKDVLTFSEWSQRRDLAEGNGPVYERPRVVA
jgi:hypothetical protein